jgi:hypothetical protein
LNRGTLDRTIVAGIAKIQPGSRVRSTYGASSVHSQFGLRGANSAFRGRRSGRAGRKPELRQNDFCGPT